MDRRSFFQTAFASAGAITANRVHLDDLLIDLEELNLKIDACARGTTEAIDKAKAYSCEVMTRFASDLNNITGRMNRLEAQQYLLVFWLALLSLLTGVDFLSSVSGTILSS